MGAKVQKKIQINIVYLLKNTKKESRTPNMRMRLPIFLFVFLAFCLLKLIDVL